jgi:hypothetical protein
VGRGTSPNSDGLDVAELELGPGLPTLRIGSASKALVYFPGLSLHPGLPTGMERRMATSGCGALQTEYTAFRVGRRVRPVGTSFTDMTEDAIAAIEELREPEALPDQHFRLGGVKELIEVAKRRASDDRGRARSRVYRAIAHAVDDDLVRPGDVHERAEVGRVAASEQKGIEPLQQGTKSDGVGSPLTQVDEVEDVTVAPEAFAPLPERRRIVVDVVGVLNVPDTDLV